MLFELQNKADRRLWIRSLLGGEQCVLCGENTSKGLDLFCADCRDRLNAEASWICPRCGAEAADCLCVSASMRLSGISRYIKLFPYVTGTEMLSPRILYRLKSRRDPLLCERIADAWAKRLFPLLMTEGRNASEICVAYVPRSRKRRRESGTDQAEELAKALAKRVGCSLFRGIHRETDGQTQKTLGRADRAKNAEHLFSCRERPKPCVLFVDDLVTTGETVSACARLLRKAGAAEVFCLSVSQTVGEESVYIPPEDIAVRGR